MRIGRTISPAAAPISLGDILNGFRGCLEGQRQIEEGINHPLCWTHTDSHGQNETLWLERYFFSKGKKSV